MKRQYAQEDLNRGYVLATDRLGRECKSPLVSVSLAIVDCHGDCDFNAISKHSAETKRYAKMRAGNSFVRDRRSPAVRHGNGDELSPPDDLDVPADDEDMSDAAS